MARRALRLGKPLIVAKIGRSMAARRAAVSHTASLTGADAAYEAVFQRYGVIRGEDQDDMLDVAAAAALCPEPRGTRVGVITISGGVGGWLADTLETNGLVVPEFSSELQAQIRAFLPSYGAAGNPIDITAQAIGTDFRVRALEALDASDEIDGIVVASSLAADTRLSGERDRLAASADDAVHAAAEIGYPVALKVQSPELPHKTEAGAVALNLRDEGTVRAAYATSLANARRAAPEASISGVLVEAMANPGLEL